MGIQFYSGQSFKLWLLSLSWKTKITQNSLALKNLDVSKLDSG